MTGSATVRETARRWRKAMGTGSDSAKVTVRLTD